MGKWQITGFNLREAVVDSTYDAFTKVKLTSRLGGPFNCPHYVNDSTVYCSVKVPYENGMKLTSHVGKFNMLTGERVPLDSIAEEGNSALITVSLAKKMIIETDVRHDRIRFYDLDGNLKKIVYGPDYSEKDDRRTRYFSEPKIAGDKILALYSGRNLREGIGHEIIVMDLDGNYIRTLDAGVWISSIVYHDKTDRVYISSDDEPQFGYFNLSEALGEPASARKVSAPVEDKALAEEAETETVEDSEPAKDSESGESIVLPNGVRVIYSSPMAANAPAYSKSRKNEGPLALADGYSHIMEPVDIVTIGANPDEATGGKYYVVCLYNPESEDVTVESIILPDARFEVEWTGRKNYIPGLLSTFILKAKKAVEQDDFRFILTYKGDKYAPQTFHINLHPE